MGCKVGSHLFRLMCVAFRLVVVVVVVGGGETFNEMCSAGKNIERKTQGHTGAARFFVIAFLFMAI